MQKVMNKTFLEDFLLECMEKYPPLDDSGWYPYGAVEEIIEVLENKGYIQFDAQNNLVKFNDRQ